MEFGKVCIIVPAYNEEETIAKVIKSIRSVNKKFRIVVVNDGSVDKTLQEAYKTKSDVINLPFNLGIGGAVQTGLFYAKENFCEYAIQVDADGQHNPQDILKLLKNSTESDLVIGSRYIKSTKYKPTFLRLLGVKIFSQLIFWTCGKRVHDSTSGYRLFNKRAIDFFCRYYPQEFPEPRSIVALLKNGYKINEVSVEMRERSGGKSSVGWFYSIYLMISISISILVESIKTKHTLYE